MRVIAAVTALLIGTVCARADSLCSGPGLTVHLREAPLGSVLAVLSDATQCNLATDVPSLRVTLEMANASAEEILGALLDTTGLTREQSGQITLLRSTAFDSPSLPLVDTRISLRLRRAPLESVFRVFSGIAEIPLNVSPDLLDDTVTLTLTDVPLTQAAGVLLWTKQLNYRQTDEGVEITRRIP